MITPEKLYELQTEAHQQSVDAGWWDTPRPLVTFICLFHSELSEALEGDRKNLMDDHLPQYDMFWVEIADYVIRCVDWLGSLDDAPDVEAWGTCHEYPAPDENVGLIAMCHYHTAMVGAFCKDRAWLMESVLVCFTYAESKNFDLLEVIDAKREYNRSRADHKPENRAKAGGKRY